VVSLSAAVPTTSLLVGELLQGGDYAGVKTTFIDGIGGRGRRLCRGTLLAGLQGPEPAEG